MSVRVHRPYVDLPEVRSISWNCKLSSPGLGDPRSLSRRRFGLQPDRVIHLFSYSPNITAEGCFPSFKEGTDAIHIHIHTLYQAQHVI